MEPMQVLFLHGIEARGWPLKAELIASLSGVVVHCPDLGSASWMQRVWITAALCLAVLLAICGGVVWAIVQEKIHVLLAILICLVAPFVMYTTAVHLVRFCLRRAYDEATARAQRAVEVLEPDVIVGQSFGAVVALRLQRPDTPLLLLSCARRYFCGWAGVPEPQCPAGVPVAVVHGTDDELNKIADAVDLVNAAKAAWLVPRESEGHMLPGLGASALAEILQELGCEYYLRPPDDAKDKGEKGEKKSATEGRKGKRREWEPEPAASAPPESETARDADDERTALLAEPRPAG